MNKNQFLTLLVSSVNLMCSLFGIYMVCGKYRKYLKNVFALATVFNAVKSLLIIDEKWQAICNCAPRPANLRRRAVAFNVLYLNASMKTRD